MASGYIRSTRHTLPGWLLQGIHIIQVPGNWECLSQSFMISKHSPLRTPQAELKFPMDYPYSPPRLRFLTPILHPNVYPVSPGVFVVIGNGFCSLVYIYYYYLKLRRTASSVYLFFIPQAKTLTAENCRLSVGIQHRVSGSFLSLLLLL